MGSKEHELEVGHIESMLYVQLHDGWTILQTVLGLSLNIRVELLMWKS